MNAIALIVALLAVPAVKADKLTLTWQYGDRSNIVFNVWATTNSFQTNIIEVYDYHSSDEFTNWTFMTWKTNVLEVQKWKRLIGSTNGLSFPVTNTQSSQFFYITASNTLSHTESK